ncbi:serine hydrolase domain-containing protein [Flavobacterium haoranii]|uniref:CubicO group peptidase, beta-lactamase class C family n=1 Tax=Flavobacterium haoranii TaxID=683124 RepID=A0A1M6FPE9_9FLAO|nr:serine hydrolase domain-containing protein [Flavobacterium haoranii]SHI99601.1 CubicO group peptidase, beta-lactamase class C family [Flavobacterium haoranii]
MKKTIFLFCLLFSSVIFSQERFEKIDEYLNYLYNNDKFMGSLCIREGENVVFNKAYGYADVDKKIEADRLTKYKIGSITKTFTAVMVLQLIEEKKLRLETKLSKYFPKVAKADSISISDLLYQRTGIPDYINHDSLTQAELNAPSIKEAIYAKIEKHESRFSPGSKFEYSNSNYYLLGGIIEKVTKKSFSENLQERIVKKADLKNTYYKTSTTDASVKESYSYTFNEKWEVTPEWKNETAFSAGAIISNPADLTRFMRNLFTEKLISKKSLDIMTDLKDGYGAGLLQAPFGDRKFYTHTGGIENFRSVVGYNVSENLGIGLIVNGDNYNRNDIMIGVLSIYYKLPFPFPSFEKLDSELITKYTGTYASAEIPIKLTIFEKNGDLMAQGTNQPVFPLTLKDKKTFIFATAGIEIDFEENSLILKQGGMKINFSKE